MMDIAELIIWVALAGVAAGLIIAHRFKKPAFGHGLASAWMGAVVITDLLAHRWLFAITGGIIFTCLLAVFINELRKR